MSEQEISYNKFEAGYTRPDKKKDKYRHAIQKYIEEEKLFVAPVQPHISGQHRSDAYKIIHPIYKSAELKDTLANCFACSKCDQIFLHLPSNGTAPFTSHKCFKVYHTAIQQAVAEAIIADKTAVEAKSKAKAAKNRSKNFRICHQHHQRMMLETKTKNH